MRVARAHTRLLVATLTALIVAACGLDLGGVRDELEAAEATWRAQQPTQYVIEYERRCLCSNAGQFIARVEGGSVVAVDPGTGIGGAEELPFAFTVERLFDTIRSAIDRESDAIEVEYDAVLGYPTRILIDADAGADDDELRVIAALRTDG